MHIKLEVERVSQLERCIDLYEESAAMVGLILRFTAPDIVADWEAIRSEQSAFLRRLLEKLGTDDA